jgi:O-antigen ligase
VVGQKVQRLTIAVVLAILAVTAFSSGLVLRYADQQAMDFGGTDEGGRLFIWSRAAGIIADHPVFGVGQGNFFDEYAARIRPEARATRGMAHAHNDPLTVGAVSGIPTALVFLALWVAVLWLLWRGYRRPDISSAERRLLLASLLGSLVFLIGSTTEATFSDEEVRQLLMFVWAVGLGVWYKTAAEPTKTIGASNLTSVK